MVATARNPEEFAGVFPAGVERAQLDFARPRTFGPVLDGVRALFLMRPPALANTRKYIDPFVDAAEAAGVRHVVFLSLLGAEKNPLLPHRRVEKHLEASGLGWTFLRARVPSFRRWHG